MKRNELTVDEYVKGIKSGELATLSRAITLVESKKEDHQKKAKEVIHKIIAKTGKAIRIGISGTPGVGKSTFIESFGQFLTSKNLKIAVLTIDPTSQITGGSILGDKTRMSKLASDPKAFVRPSPSGDSLGGVASKTRESMLLCEAAGYDVVIVETVGVGQSEITVSKIVDFFLLLMQPGGGDDLQGIKRGILELADLIAVNKADGDQFTQAKIAKSEYESALHILRQEEVWQPSVITCSGLKGIGLEDIWEQIEKFYKLMRDKNILEEKRSMQLQLWIWDLLMDKIKSSLKANAKLHNKINSDLKDIQNHSSTVLDLVDDLYDDVLGKK